VFFFQQINIQIGTSTNHSFQFLPRKQLRASGQIWSVEYLGEGGTDASGLFRDSISTLVEEIESTTLKLLVQVPNARGQVGFNQDKWIPNPDANSTIQKSMFIFFGKIIGIAIRGHLVNLNLPPLFWKKIGGSKIVEKDIREIEEVAFKMIDEIREAEKEKKNF